MKQIKLTPAAIARLNQARPKGQRAIRENEVFNIEEYYYELSQKQLKRFVEASSQTDYLFIRVKAEEYEEVEEYHPTPTLPEGEGVTRN
jgi:hypothetical protein